MKLNKKGVVGGNVENPAAQGNAVAKGRKAFHAMDDDGMRSCVDHLVHCYAEIKGKTYLDVTRAVLSSKTLAAHGYLPSQNGLLTLDQLRAAVQLLWYWIGVEISGGAA